MYRLGVIYLLLSFMKQLSKLKGVDESSPFKNISISHDMTKHERDQNKAMLEETKRLNTEEKSGKQLVFLFPILTTDLMHISSLSKNSARLVTNLVSFCFRTDGSLLSISFTPCIIMFFLKK
jgi:hypothetical protein